MRDPSAFRARKRGQLPHWDVPGGTYFITYCLRDALPRVVVERLRLRRAELDRAATQLASSPAVHQRALRVEAEKHLDRGDGNCWLRQPALARIAADALRFFDRQRYDLLAWVVMPNHVHTVTRVYPGTTIDSVLHSWKSYAAARCNRVLGRQGPFWQQDYFDRSIRDRAHLERAMRYVERNPVRAHLDGWELVEINWDRMDG